MTTQVFVDGQEGTTGLKIFEYLRARRDITLLTIDDARRKDPAARAERINASDVTFLCLPDVASREAVALTTNPQTCVIDASTAFRIDPNWAYGLPEMDRAQRARVRASKRIAVPGCHASAFVLAVRPLITAGLIAADYPVDAFSLTGYSGGGKKMIAEYESATGTRLATPRPYALGLEHKHLPEMRVHAGLAAAPIFIPVVGNFYKGLAVTVYLHPERMAKRATPAEIRDYLAEYYAGETFIRVAPLQAPENLDNGCFDVQGSNDTNRADLFVFGHDDRIVVVARLDNLGKGASGAALQCMNLHIGANEAEGLRS